MRVLWATSDAKLRFMSNGLHHLHIRKRMYKNLERYPHSSVVKRALDSLMYLVAVITPLVLLPQVFQLFVYKSAAGLSITTWFLLGCINVLWVFYGLVHKEVPILIANLLVGILNFVVVYGIILYS